MESPPYSLEPTGSPSDDSVPLLNPLTSPPQHPVTLAADDIDRYLQGYLVEGHVVNPVVARSYTAQPKKPVPAYLSNFLDYIEFNKYLGVYFDRYRYSNISGKTDKVKDISTECLKRATSVKVLVDKFATPLNSQTTLKRMVGYGTADAYNKMVEEAATGNDRYFVSRVRAYLNPAPTPTGVDVGPVIGLMIKFAEAIVTKERQIAEHGPLAIDYKSLKELLMSVSVSMPVQPGGSRRRKHSRRRHRSRRSASKKKYKKVRKSRRRARS